MKDMIPNAAQREPKAHTWQIFQSLSNWRYREYSIGQLISIAGTQMQAVAISWVVYKITDSPLALGFVQFVGTLPLLLFTYAGGVLADRTKDQRRIIVMTQWLEMLQALILTALALTGHLTVFWLVVMAVYLGCCNAIETSSRQAMIPQLVTKQELTNAIGLNSAIFNVARLISPMLAGFAIAGGGDILCFMLNALSYVAAIITLARIKPRAAEDGTQSSLAGKGDLDAEHDGTTLWQWIMQPHIRDVILLVACLSTFGFQFSVLLPVIAVQVLLDTSGAFTGYLSAAMGVGALAGSLFVANEHGDIPLLKRNTGLAGLSLAVGVLILACARGLVSHLVASSPWLGLPLTLLSLAAMAVCGCAIAVQLGSSNSQLQLQVPKHLRGRVMSVYSTCMMGFLPFSSLVAGWLTENFGLLFTLASSGAVMGAASIVYLIQVRK